MQLEIEAALPNIMADQTKVKEIIYNLLSNAINLTLGFWSDLLCQYYPKRRCEIEKKALVIDDNALAIPRLFL